jgi:methylamine dehydrogenase accessory protein MauD
MLSSSHNSQSSGAWGLDVGEQAPSFMATDFDGNIVHLEDFAGQRRILAFILPGCSSCAETMKTLNSFTQSEDAVTVLIIGGSDRELNRAYGIEHETQFTVLTPTRDFHADLYRLQEVPFVFVLDEAGIIRAKGIVSNDEQLQQLLIAAFALTSASQ